MFHRIGKKFFDSASFTPICTQAYSSVMQVYKKQHTLEYGNPNSSHTVGRNTQTYLQDAKKQIAERYMVKESHIIYTSGASESNYLAIRSVVMETVRKGKEYQDIHIVSTAEEHPSLLNYFTYLESLGASISLVQPDIHGGYSAESITTQVTPHTSCVSVHLVNSVHGRVNEVGNIAKEVKKKCPEVVVHIDATQGGAYYNCAPISIHGDLVTISSEKMYGPQGCGVLVIHPTYNIYGLTGRKDVTDIKSGTPTTALIAGFSSALAHCEAHTSSKKAHEHFRNLQYTAVVALRNMSKKMNIPITIGGIKKDIMQVKPKDVSHIAPHILYASLKGIQHPYLATLLDTAGFCVSTEVACGDNKGEGIRISFLHTHKKNDVLQMVDAIRKNLTLAKYV